MIENVLNPNSMDYIPTWDEMKLPPRLRNKLESYIEDEMEAEKVQKELESHIERWQLRHREVVRKKEIAKTEVKTRKLLAHWFATLPKEKIEILIDETRHLADQVLDERLASSSAAWESNYIEKLRARVKRNPFTVEATTFDKMRRFPIYDAANDELSGAPYSYYRLWAHVFKSESRGSGHIKSKRRG